MARNWEYKESTGTLTRSYFVKTGTDEKGKPIYEESAKMLNMELPDLFPEILDFDEVQKNAVINGLKQKLDDAIARSSDEKLTETEKRAVQSALWDRISIERKWNAESRASSGPTVSLKLVVPAMQKAGLDSDAIAKAIGKSLEVVQKFIDTGIED